MTRQLADLDLSALDTRELIELLAVLSRAEGRQLGVPGFGTETCAAACDVRWELSRRLGG